MLRTFIEEILLFALPFAAFAAWLILTKRNPLDISHWSGRKFALAAIGLTLGIISIIYASQVAETHRGAYVPPFIENGRLVPGKFAD